MHIPKFKRLPKHIGIIPDGNRRWAQGKGFSKADGYHYGISPGFELYELCLQLGIGEMTFYGFTNDNLKRPANQCVAFKKACVDAVEILAHRDAALLVIGNDRSQHFPEQLKQYTKRVIFGHNLMKINFLVNYDWNWDLNRAVEKSRERSQQKTFLNLIASRDISRIDLIIRWGGRRRLSGLLPVQSVYSDFFVVDDFWPDFEPNHLFNALKWYETQDITLGG